MNERRQATRRTPIEVELEDGRVFTAHPLPWMVANDLGHEIVRQNLEASNDFVKMLINDEGIPQLEMQFAKKINDWNTLLKMAYPDEPDEKIHTPKDPSLDESADLILAALDVNHLEHVKHLVDPNFQPPMNPGGTTSSQETEGANGAKTGFTPSSDSPVLEEVKP
jgi:hypothetical protein